MLKFLKPSPRQPEPQPFSVVCHVAARNPAIIRNSTARLNARRHNERVRGDRYED